MTELENNISSLRERLAAMRQNFDGEFSALVTELEQAQNAVDQLAPAEDSQGKRLRQLEERTEGQSELIDTLTQEAQEARTLRTEVRDRDLQIERLASELESKKDLVLALRQRLDEADQVKATARQRDKKIFEQQHELEKKQQSLDEANRQIVSLRSEIEAMSETSADETAIDNAELGALRVELDARKTMIKSLRADADRADAIAAQLEAKREAVSMLEDSIDQHAATIAELRRSVDLWKKKYQAAKGEILEDQDQTLAEPPAFTETEIEALKALEEEHPATPERTIAIDMRGALKEARSRKARAKS